MSTPSETLARRILERLSSEGLMPAREAEKLLPKILSGKVRPEEWRLPIEIAAQREESQS